MKPIFSSMVFFLMLSSCSAREISPGNVVELIPELRCLLEKDERVIFVVKGPLCKDDSAFGLERYSILTDRAEKKFYLNDMSKDYVSLSLRSAYLYIFTKFDGKYSLSFFEGFGDGAVKLECKDYHKDGNTELFLLTSSGNDFWAAMINCGHQQFFSRIFGITSSQLDDTSKAIVFRDIDGDGIDEILVAQRDYYREPRSDYSDYDIAVWKWNESEGKYILEKKLPFTEVWGTPQE
jgi:hypothetical protein